SGKFITSAMRIVVTILLLFSNVTAFCQYDSTYSTNNIKYKNTFFWGLHADAGWNKSWFSSLGVSCLGANANNMHGATHFVVYAAGEINLATYDNPSSFFYGYKAGAECGSNLLMMGLELRGYTDFKGREHTVFMPKAGLSVFGYMNLTYGYNVFQDDFNVFGIGHSQIAVSVNLARKVFTESFVPEE
ncbi:MAG TPA: hypothetical protein VIN07_13720, partial [Flavipsychrobacter sp.]